MGSATPPMVSAEPPNGVVGAARGARTLNSFCSTRWLPNQWSFSVLPTGPDPQDPRQVARRSRRWELVFGLLQEAAPALSTIACSAAVSACEVAGKWELAQEVFWRMRDLRIARNVVTYGALISACGRGHEWVHLGGLLRTSSLGDRSGSRAWHGFVRGASSGEVLLLSGPDRMQSVHSGPDWNKSEIQTFRTAEIGTQKS